MASNRYPRNLIHHLTKIRNYKIETYKEGIYYITGDFFPIQLLVIPQLSTEEHAWLKSLTKRIDKEVLNSILSEYRPEEKNEHKDVVVDMLIKSNEDVLEQWKEENDMSGALLELMRPEMEAYAREHAKEHAKNLLKQGVSAEVIETGIPELSSDEIQQLEDDLKRE